MLAAPSAYAQQPLQYSILSFEPEFFFGVPMSLRRVGGLAAIALATMICVSCGEVYRPVVIPIATTPPNPANFHAVFGISANAQVNPGAALQIDVSGDTDIGSGEYGHESHSCRHPAQQFPSFRGECWQLIEIPIIPSQRADRDRRHRPFRSRMSAATFANAAWESQSALSRIPTCRTHRISAYRSIRQWFCFLPSGFSDHRLEIQPRMYVANYRRGTMIPMLHPNLTSTRFRRPFVEQSTSQHEYDHERLPYLTSAGAHPVPWRRRPTRQNLYVVNQGNDTVDSIFLRWILSTRATISGRQRTPVWAVARVDNQRVYVLSQGRRKR